MTAEEYNAALEFFERKATILYKRAPNEVNISPYNTVILSLLKANMNIQFCTSIYAVIAYLTSYLRKPERSMSELMRKTAKECESECVRQVMGKVGNILINKRETSLHEAIMRVLSMPLRRSNNDVVFVPTGDPKKRCRVLKSPTVLQRMLKNNPDDLNIFAANIFDKYAARPDHLEDLCLADFVSTYKHFRSGEPDPEQQFFQLVTDYAELLKQGQVIQLKMTLGRCACAVNHVSSDGFMSSETRTVKVITCVYFSCTCHGRKRTICCMMMERTQQCCTRFLTK